MTWKMLVNWMTQKQAELVRDGLRNHYPDETFQAENSPHNTGWQVVWATHPPVDVVASMAVKSFAAGYKAAVKAHCTMS